MAVLLVIHVAGSHNLGIDILFGALSAILGGGLALFWRRQDLRHSHRAEQALSEKHRELQEIAQQLEQSRNMLQLVIESIPVRIFWKDQDLRYLGCNSLLAGDAGFSHPQQLLGHDDFAMGWREQARQYQADDRMVMESRMPRVGIIEPQTSPTGTALWLSTSKVPLLRPDGAVFGVLGVYEDITERMQAETAMRQSEALHRALIGALDVSLCRWLPDTTLVFTNEKYRRIFGIQDAATRQQWLNFLPEATRVAMTDFCHDLVRNPRSIAYEHPVTVEDGSIRHYQWIDTPILDDNGQLVEFQSVGIDITERRKAEELVSAQRDLARVISVASSSQTVWPLCLEVALRVSDMDCGGVYLFDQDGQMLELVHYQGLGAAFIQASLRYAADAPNTQIVRAGKAVYLTADAINQEEILSQEGLRSVAIIPIYHHQQVLGCMNIASHTSTQVDAFARHALETIAPEIGNIIVSLRNERQMRALVTSLDDIVLEVDDRGVCLNIWAANEELLLYPKEQLRGQCMLDLPEYEYSRQYAEVLQRVLASGHPESVVYPMEIAGRRHWFTSHVSPILTDDTTPRTASILIRDITEQRQVEETLKAEQLRFAKVAATFPGAICTFLLRPDGMLCIPYASRAFEDLYGLSRADVADTIDPLARQVPADQLSQLIAAVTESARTLQPWRHEYQYQHPTKGAIWIEGFSMPVREPDGSTIWHGVSIDITTRKQIEQELLELNYTLEERVKQRTAEVQDLYENAPIGYHSLDAEGTIIRANQTLLDWLGYTRAELIGRPVTTILSPASLAIFAESFPIFKERGWLRDLEIDLRHRDGAVIPALLSATAIYDAHGSYVMSRSTVFNNTERNKAEAALRESEAQNRLLFEASPDAVVLIDEAGKMVRINRAFEQLTGYTSAQLAGQTLDQLRLISLAQIRQLEALILQQLEVHQRSAAVEFRLTHASGEVHDVGARVFGMNFRGRRHYLTTMRDITTEKKGEETLRRANAELAQAARAKDEFLANMSHELRTPLNAVLALSESLMEQIHGPLNERQLESLNHIEISGRHLLALINDILDLSKVEAGRLDLQIEPVWIADVCQSSLAFVREIALKKSLRLTFQLNDQKAEMEADPKRLKQMLVNLLSNAVKFTPARGQVSLDVTTDAEAGVIRFTVQDSGIGIIPEDLAQLFQPFRQLDSSLSRQHEGTGLGLALVRRLAELHGGSVMVESVVDTGSRFTIALPYHQPPALELRSHTAPPPEPHAGALRSALVIEDSVSAAEQLTRYLEEADLHVVVHPQGEGALAQAIRLRPGVIFLDLLMPDRPGMEVLGQLKADPHTRDTPVIIVSVVDDRAKGLAAGAAEHLVKPVSREALRRALGAVATATGAGPPAPQPAPAGARILLAEDNEVNILAIGDYLQARGYQLVLARNGREAIERADKARPDLILMDIQMPEIDGLEAIRRLRARPEHTSTPIIALTALAMPGDRERCLAAGASDYLTKPVSLRGLAETITRLLT